MTNLLRTSSKRRLEFLENQTKAVTNVQEARLAGLDARDKSVENIQQTRLEFLNNQTKAVENVHQSRLMGIDARGKSVVR